MPTRNPIPVGSRFARLVTLALGERGKDGRYRCPCLCDCGKLSHVLEESLRDGNTRSCGCLHKEGLRARQFVHGQIETRTYRIWQALRTRCHNKKLRCWKYYGGAGVKVAERWDDYRNFLADMGECPPGKTIDRWPNPRGNYEPGNCRWATWKEQMRNMSRNRIETVFGVTDCMAALCERFGAKSSVVRRRLKRGWPIERAFTEPSRSVRGPRP
jgi:hypothetical protein